MTELSAPLAEIVRRASERTVEGPAAKLKLRFANASDEIIVLCDCSGSMADRLGDLTTSKWEHLRITLEDILKTHPKIRVIAFASDAELASGASLPTPCGGTDLARGLQLAGQFKPRKTIVISDGMPDSKEHARAAADAMTGAIDTIYCGPDGETEAIGFLRSLARSTGGCHVTWAGYRSPLGPGIRALLPPPVASPPPDNRQDPPAPKRNRFGLW